MPSCTTSSYRQRSVLPQRRSLLRVYDLLCHDFRPLLGAQCCSTARDFVGDRGRGGVPFGHAAAFAVAALVIIVIPGPNVLFAIGRALTVGRRSAVLSVVGAVAGSFVPLVAVVFGLGAVLMASTVLFLVVKVIGAGYLIYLGVSTFRRRRQLAEVLRSAVPGADGARVFRQGFVVGATNPKTIVFFGA
ncbi:LysE family translocator [Nocardia sp. NPDC059177]|uniref:LysE family translocator n=1 Tax=Nocardia sp. NPDC059177 TaxID=3346759 RepID=UPI0036851064